MLQKMLKAGLSETPGGDYTGVWPRGAVPWPRALPQMRRQSRHLYVHRLRMRVNQLPLATSARKACLHKHGQTSPSIFFLAGLPRDPASASHPVDWRPLVPSLHPLLVYSTVCLPPSARGHATFLPRSFLPSPPSCSCVSAAHAWPPACLPAHLPAGPQDVDTGTILMQAFANKEAVAATLSSGNATFFSRSRSALWMKGESSGNVIAVKSIYVDCDRDSLIYMGAPCGPTCHTVGGGVGGESSEGLLLLGLPPPRLYRRGPLALLHFVHL